MLETVGSGFERLVYDRLEDFTLESVDLNIEAQRFRLEKIWVSVLAPTLMNDLDRIHLLLGQAPHRSSCFGRRIGLDRRAGPNPGIPSINSGRRMTARSS